MVTARYRGLNDPVRTGTRMRPTVNTHTQTRRNDLNASELMLRRAEAAAERIEGRLCLCHESNLRVEGQREMLRVQFDGGQNARPNPQERSEPIHSTKVIFECVAQWSSWSRCSVSFPTGATTSPRSIHVASPSTIPRSR